ncbi:MAG: TetR/AcrR family transcriptional regulator [Prevotella sp.]|nr:TetR/AcrR family transcriptional regulator [Prevotella sp.]
MDDSNADYIKNFIVQALFKLMNEYYYEKISVVDIAQKACIGRATFYRYFKSKDDVIQYYFDHSTAQYQTQRRYIPRCKEDYLREAKLAFTMFKDNQTQLKLLRKAHLETFYLDYLNRNMVAAIQSEHPAENRYVPYMFAGLVFNVSMAWLDHDCRDSIDDLATMIIDTFCH